MYTYTYIHRGRNINRERKFFDAIPRIVAEEREFSLEKAWKERGCEVFEYFRLSDTLRATAHLDRHLWTWIFPENSSLATIERDHHDSHDHSKLLSPSTLHLCRFNPEIKFTRPRVEQRCVCSTHVEQSFFPRREKRNIYIYIYTCVLRKRPPSVNMQIGAR